MIDKLKTLAGDTVVYGVATIVGKFLFFLLTPIYTNFVAVEEMGEYILIFSIIAFINILYSFGMETAFFRFYKKDDLTQSKIVYTHTYLSILIVSAVVSVIVFFNADIIASLISDRASAAGLVRYGILIPLLDAMMFVPFALLRLQRKTRRFAYTKLFLILLAIGFNFIFVIYLDMGVLGIIIAQLIASFIGVLIFLPDVMKYLHFTYDSKLLKGLLRFGLPTIPASFSAIILHVIDKPIYKALTNSTELGYYGVVYKLGIPMMLLVTAFDYAWKPFYLSNFTEEGAKKLYARVFTYFTMIASVVFLLISFYLDFIVRIPFIGGDFINPVYWPVLGIVPLILAGYYFNGVYYNFAAGFNITKQTKYLPVAIGIGALVNIGMNFWLIPIYGFWGAAWATLIAYAVAAIVLYLLLIKVYPVRYEWRRIIILILTTLGVYLGGKYLSDGHNLTMVFVIRTGALIAFAILLKVFGFFTKSEIEGMKRLVT